MAAKTKKADVIERPQAFDHVGLLCNEPPGMAGLLFIQSSEDRFLVRTSALTPRRLRQPISIPVSRVRAT